MADKDKAEPPAPEVLKPREETAEDPSTDAPASKGGDSATAAKTGLRSRRATYRPSHKATFIGLAVVIAILVINAGVIIFVVRNQSKDEGQTAKGEVTISQGVLDKLGVNRTAVDELGIELVVNPDARFLNKVQVGGDLSIGGQLKLNTKFSANDVSAAKLEAGDTSLTQLNVNGDATANTLNLRRDLNVTGSTRLQGAVVVSQLLTVNNSVNVAGNLSVGGALTTRSFQASSLTSDTTLTIGGHIITRGVAPGVGPGTALGSSGTISISGNDAAGTIGVNIGTGASSGIIANVVFRQTYGNIPKVVVTAVGAGLGPLYVNRSASGFSVGTKEPTPPGGYAIDYIVMQ